MNQLSYGTKIESEHRDVLQKIKRYLRHKKKFPPNQQVFKWIAETHIREFPTYYTSLKKMEAKLKAKRRKHK
jgi:hypothetical protein